MKLAVTLLVFCVTALLALGLTMLYSSTMGQPGAHYLLKQLVWCPFALALCVAAASLDYRLLKKIAVPLLITSVVLLGLVLERHIGLKINNARRWLGYGSFRLQPSELAKLSLIIGLAWYGEYFQRQMQTWKRGVVFPAAIVAVVLGLIFVEPDRGTTILMACVAGIMLVIAGVRWVYIFPSVFAALAGLAISLYHDPMRSRRISARVSRLVLSMLASARFASSGWVSMT